MISSILYERKGAMVLKLDPQARAHAVARRVMMVLPRSFRCNEETIVSNAFQTAHGVDGDANVKAVAESRGLADRLRQAGVEVIAYEEPMGADTPDALFPNNWFASLPDGRLFLFPMQALNRRREVHPEWLRNSGDSAGLTDLRPLVNRSFFLEGTGSMILDHAAKRGYACVSERTSPEAIRVFAEHSGYAITSFEATDEKNQPFYHTNVMMALGVNAVVLCSESIRDSAIRKKISADLRSTGRALVEISQKQVREFAGNMLQVANASGELFWVCSDRAYSSLSTDQKTVLQVGAEFITAPLSTIETLGGGSARCMLGELF